MLRTIPKQTWLTLRRPDGVLEPLTQMWTDDLLHLAYQAGTLGIPLQDWLVEILRAAVEEIPPEHETAESFLGKRYLELSLPEDLLDQLTRQYWDSFDEAMNLGGQIDSWLFFVSGPGLVLLTARLARKGKTPAEVARALLREMNTRMGTLIGQEDAMNEAEDHDLKAMVKAGQYRLPVEAAGTLAAS